MKVEAVEGQAGKGSLFILRLPMKSPLSQDPNSSSAEWPILPPEPEETAG